MVNKYQVIDWLKRDARTAFFVNAIQYINWEKVEGDVLEFGVSVGKSLGLIGQLLRENLEYWRYTEPACVNRRVCGLDTFRGLPKDDVEHPRWEEGSFATNYLHDHPFLAYGADITPQSIEDIFRACELALPELRVGLFNDSAPEVVPAKYSKAALVHIDSDLYQSARDALRIVEPILQEGTIICFDDYFMYKGNPAHGEARAFREFLDEHPAWGATQYQTYSVFCNSFIMYRK